MEEWFILAPRSPFSKGKFVSDKTWWKCKSKCFHYTWYLLNEFSPFSLTTVVWVCFVFHSTHSSFVFKKHLIFCTWCITVCCRLISAIGCFLSMLVLLPSSSSCTGQWNTVHTAKTEWRETLMLLYAALKKVDLLHRCSDMHKHLCAQLSWINTWLIRRNWKVWWTSIVLSHSSKKLKLQSPGFN